MAGYEYKKDLILQPKMTTTVGDLAWAILVDAAKKHPGCKVVTTNSAPKCRGCRKGNLLPPGSGTVDGNLCILASGLWAGYHGMCVPTKCKECDATPRKLELDDGLCPDCQPKEECNKCEKSVPIGQMFVNGTCLACKFPEK